MTLTAITLFSGGGGVDLGLELLGIKTIEAVEYDPAIAYTYAYNFPETQVKVIDVADWSSGLSAYLLHISPPCVNYSQANLKKKEVTQNDTAWLNSVYNYLTFHEPQIVTLENVCAFNKSEAAEAFRTLLAARGYTVTEYKVNFHLMGVPQARTRTLWLATKSQKALGALRKGLKDFTIDTHYPTWLNALEDLLDTAERTKLTNAQEQSLEGLDRSESYLIPRVGYYGKPKATPSNRPAPTLRAHLADDGKGGSRSQILTIWHQGQALNVDERMLMRLSSFPAGYQFTLPGLSHACRILGNAVPPVGYATWLKAVI